MVGEKVYWFQNESDPSLNSNVFEVAQKIVQKHFPGQRTQSLSFTFQICDALNSDHGMT